MWSSALPRLLARTSISTTTRRRTFLSEAYRCPAAWAGRLQTAVLQRCRPESFYYELDGRFSAHGRCSAIDIDIFANALTDGSYTDEVADLLYKLRQTAETTSTLESTGHAVCRLYLEHVPDVHELLAILDDRISYGVFLDAYTANLAMDKLVRECRFTEAARIATFMMLQEEVAETEITRALALYACWRWTREPQTFERPRAVADLSADPAAEAEAAAAAAKPKGPAAKKKKVEEVRVRVDFIRNEYFDDHFDLREAGHLVGKTLAMIGRSLEQEGGEKAALAASAQLLGLWHHGKVEEAGELVKRLTTGGESAAVHADAVQAVVEAVEAIGEPSAEVQAFGEQLRALKAAEGVLVREDLENALCALANAAVAKNEQSEIEKQVEIYSAWCTERQTALDAELDRQQRVQRLAEIERRTADMEREEQRLWFFENEDQLDLQIDSKRVFYPKRWDGKKKKPRVVDAGYVPPEIVRTLPSVQ